MRIRSASSCTSETLSAVRSALAAALFAGSASGWTQVADPEREQLQLLVHQIELMERTARQAASVSNTAATRYRFDYQRLLDDIARVRSGIQDYLTPQRAQPRDTAALHGDYTRERDGRSDVSCR